MPAKLPFIGLVALAIATALPGSAFAQYPTKPIRIVTGTAPGGAPDVAARLLADRLTPVLGQPVVVENKTGANGNIAGETVARSAPDGHTLLIASDSIITVNPHVREKMPFDTMKDLMPVASVFRSQFYLSVHPSVPAKTLPELVEHARKAEPPLRFASAGPGSMHHLGIEMFKLRAGIDLIHVPYRGGAPAGRATVAGDTHIVLAGAGAAGLIQSGKLRALARTSAKPAALFPGLAPISEFFPGYDVTNWAGIFAPVGTPAAVVDRLRSEIHAALADSDLAQKLTRVGPDPLILPPGEFAALIRANYLKYGELVRSIGVKID